MFNEVMKTYTYCFRRLAQGRDPWDHPSLDAVLWIVAAGLLGQWILRLCGVI